jgi:hypothetical protein
MEENSDKLKVINFNFRIKNKVKMKIRKFSRRNLRVK